MISCSCDSLTRGLIVILLNIFHHCLPQHVPTLQSVVQLRWHRWQPVWSPERGPRGDGQVPPPARNHATVRPSPAQAGIARLLPTQLDFSLDARFSPRGGLGASPETPVSLRSDCAEVKNVSFERAQMLVLRWTYSSWQTLMSQVEGLASVNPLPCMKM